MAPSGRDFDKKKTDLIVTFLFFFLPLDSGASGGVYALVGAHVANVVMNYKEMRFGIVRSLIFGVLIVADVALALYKRYGTDEDTKVGYMAHLGGFFGGLFLGNRLR